MLSPKEKVPVIIGFGYRARQGKDSVVQHIIDTFGGKYDIRRYAMGDELKAEVNTLDQEALCIKYSIPYDNNPDMSDPKCQTKHGKQSALLQYWGTEVRRAEDPFYWVKKVDARVMAEQPQIALLSDMRFWNEFYWVLANKGYPVKVERIGYTDPSRDSGHVSEIQLETAKFFAHIKVQEGELDQLKADAIEVFNAVLQDVAPVVEDIPGVMAA